MTIIHMYYTQEGRKVNSVSFENLLDSSIRNQIQNAILDERDSRTNKIPCDQVSDLLIRGRKDKNNI